MGQWWTDYGEATKTAIGFFWKAGWAFVMGYAVSAMIQAFVPKARLAPRLGKPTAKSVSLATIFGMISSSCSFAALATARSLVVKGAHFLSAVAFMFASTNLVIELGILILIFLGWQFLAAEIVGGLILIAISSVLIRMTYPKQWMEAAREKVEANTDDEPEDFDWKQRLSSWDGWRRVGMNFVMEWKMVWQEILIGFTVAGFVATFVPDSFWKAIFLADQAEQNPGNFLIVLENAAVAPFVAAATFIGSMGNIPLATVLASGGVLFGGIMGFIYSDLMVPPLVKINAKYYGWRVALYIASIMYVSIVITSICLHYGFLLIGITPESKGDVQSMTQFKVDYTLFLNIAALLIAAAMLYLRHLHMKHADHSHHEHHHDDNDNDSHAWHVQTVVTYIFMAILAVGLVAWGTSA